MSDEGSSVTSTPIPPDRRSRRSPSQGASMAPDTWLDSTQGTFMRPFDPYTPASNTAVRWELWLQQFELHAKNREVIVPEKKRTLLLLNLGTMALRLFNSLATRGPDTDYNAARNALNAHFRPQLNADFERFQMSLARQRPAESLDAFHGRLREMAIGCDFPDEEFSIRQQVIHGMSSDKLRKQVISAVNLPLADILERGRHRELADTRAAEMEAAMARLPLDAPIETEVAAAVSTDQGRRNSQANRPSSWAQRDRRPDNRNPPGRSGPCRWCGGDQHGWSACPAQGTTCRKCGCKNHFARVCKNSEQQRDGQQQDSENSRPDRRKTLPRRARGGGRARARAVADDDSASGSSDRSGGEEETPTRTSRRHPRRRSYETAHMISAVHPTGKTRRTNTRSQPSCTVTLGTEPVKMVIDTGATVNVMPAVKYEQLDPKPTLQDKLVRLYTYGGKRPLHVCGSFRTNFQYNGKSTSSRVYVVDAGIDTLLSCKTAESLGIIKFSFQVSSRQLDTLITKHRKLFQGIGCLKGREVKLHIDPTVEPRAVRHRRVPFHMREAVRQELQKLEDAHIIEKTSGPTPWVSPMVVTGKPKQPGAVRVCIDMRLPNVAIGRERHITPTIDEIIVDLTGAKVFSKLDLRSGYHQLKLARASRYITTFTTHLGLRRYRRLNFGISSAAEIFQNEIRKVLQDLPGTLNVSDDILVYGASHREHIDRLAAVLQRLEESGLTLHAEKCEFEKAELSFFGYVFNDKGVSADPAKVQDVKTAAPPTSASEVRSFMGMATYCARFIPNLATIASPLRALTCTDAVWNWGPEQESAFQRVKDALLGETTMAYFDIRKKTELLVDASPVGLGAVLTQRDDNNTVKPIAFASRALTKVERNYAHIEKEALAILWGCRHFQVYLVGHAFTVFTDHKPLVPIFKGSASHPPARIERWLLQLQHFDAAVLYRAGADNPADYLSRHPRDATAEECITARETEEHVCVVVACARPKAIQLAQLVSSTANDPCLQLATHAIRSGDWKMFLQHTNGRTPAAQELLQGLFSVRAELTVSEEGLVLKGHCIVVPLELTNQVLALAHEGHQGVLKSLAYLRSRMWMPNVRAKLEDLIHTCIACQATGRPGRPDPITSAPRSTTRWESVSVDFCTIHNDSYLLVAIDECTRYPEVEPVRSTDAMSVITALEKMFAVHGLPKQIKSDNGPPFKSREIMNFFDNQSIKHHRITPCWPQANGDAERFMASLNKTLRIAKLNNLPWLPEVFRFLRVYRTTPHSATDVAPAALMFGVPIQGGLPQDPSWSPPSVDVEKMEEKRVRHNQRESDTRHAKPNDIQIGDHVLVQHRGTQSKLRPNFEPEPWQVSEKNQTMITAARGNESVTRNASAFKKVSSGMWKHQTPGDTRSEQQEPPITPVRSPETPSRTPQRAEGSASDIPENNSPLQASASEGSATNRTTSSRYQLRCNPKQSSRLHGYVLEHVYHRHTGSQVTV